MIFIYLKLSSSSLLTTPSSDLPPQPAHKHHLISFLTSVKHLHQHQHYHHFHWKGNFSLIAICDWKIALLVQKKSEKGFTDYKYTNTPFQQNSGKCQLANTMFLPFRMFCIFSHLYGGMHGPGLWYFLGSFLWSHEHIFRTPHKCS